MTKKQRYEFDDIRATATRAKIARTHGEMNCAELTFHTKTGEVISFQMAGQEFIAFLNQQMATYQAIYPRISVPHFTGGM